VEEASETREEQPVAESVLEEDDRSALWGRDAHLLEEIAGLEPAAPQESSSEPAPGSPAASEPAALQQEASEPSVSVTDDWARKILSETESAPIAAISAPQPGEMPVHSMAASADELQQLAEKERLHSDAKRFARLLVSEIKLYNEQRVLNGRENKDIYVRLKKDIDKSREMYDKRVPLSVSRKIDYFHDEVIRILGENDPTTLGSDYPGPRVES
jgi:hypothetical protein